MCVIVQRFQNKLSCEELQIKVLGAIVGALNGYLISGTLWFFLDYLATGALNVDQGKSIVAGIAEGCRQSGCALIGGETAEMPGIYAEGDYDLAGFSVGAAERGSLLPCDDVTAGDVLIGLPSSGPHSNGFSLIRKVVEVSGLSYKDAAPFDPDRSLGETLLEPTRIYVKPVLATNRNSKMIKALAHITGGGFVDNIPRVLPDHLMARIDLSVVTVPPVFHWLQKSGGIAETEMLRTFNCGIGMIAIVSDGNADHVMDLLVSQGEAPLPLGRLETRAGSPVEFTGSLAN